MKKALITLTPGIFVILFFTIDFPLKEKTLYGKYVNTNYQNPICCVEAPHEADTLILFRDGHFESKFYGKGRFEVSNGIFPGIKLQYAIYGESASYKTCFSNKLFGKPQIFLNEDMNHVYTKID